MRNKYSYNVAKIAQGEKFDEEIRKASVVPADEKAFGSMLNKAGREAYYMEYFHGVKVGDQEIEKIGIFNDPRTTVSFKMGYEKGKLLVEKGVVPPEYQTQNINKTK